jgi:hypothetical protein
MDITQPFGSMGVIPEEVTTKPWHNTGEVQRVLVRPQVKHY